MFRLSAISKTHAKKLAALSMTRNIQRCTAIIGCNKFLVKGPIPGSKRFVSSRATFEFKKESPTERITSFELDNAVEMLNITLSNDEARQYPFVWLYDNCLCDTCRNKLRGMRSQSMSTLNVDIKPTDIHKTKEGLEIKWCDGHSALYPEQWLVSHTFPASISDKVLPWLNVVNHWGNEMQETVPTFSYNDLIQDDQVLYDWIETMKVHGIALIPDAETGGDNLEILANRVGYPVPNNYGPIFKVENLMPPSDKPWIEPPLPLHTDLSLDVVPEILMLHTLMHADEGAGAHQFVDGFKAAKQLKEKDPEAFDMLTSTDALFSLLEPKHISFYRSVNPTIKLDDCNRIASIHFSNHSRDPELPLSAVAIKPFYLALKTFYNLLNHPDNVIQRNTIRGEIVCLNNHRCLHGRTSYVVQPGKSNPRLVKGCYVSWQDAYSKQRVLNGMRDKFLKGNIKV